MVRPAGKRQYNDAHADLHRQDSDGGDVPDDIFSFYKCTDLTRICPSAMMKGLISTLLPIMAKVFQPSDSTAMATLRETA